MAAGDLTVFEQFYFDLAAGLHDLRAAEDIVKLAFVTSTQSISAALADPRWGAAGSTDLSSNEASGGNYASGGADISNTLTLTGGDAVVDGTDPSVYTKNGSNPADIRYGILYNDTDTGKRAILALDLGAVIDGTAGDLTITFNASGIFEITA